MTFVVPGADAFDRLSGPTRAAIWMCMSGAGFAAMGGLIRLVSYELHPFEIAFFRTFFGLAWIAPWLFRHGGEGLRTGRRWFFALRASFGLIGMLGSFSGVAYMGIAESVSLSFTGPLFATIGAALFLGETVRLRRWSATIIGFLGVLVIVRPSPETFNPVAIAVLLSAAAGAGSMLVVKSLSATESPNAIVTYMVLYMTPMTLVPALFVWEWPSLHALLLLVVMGGFGTMSHIAMTRGFAAADASFVLPFDYMRLPFSALIGYFAFAETPDVWTFVGAGIIAASSIYIAHREARLARRRARDAMFLK